MKTIVISITFLILSLNDLCAQDGFTAQDRKMLVENRKLLLDIQRELVYIKKDILEIKKDIVELKKDILILKIGQGKLEVKFDEMDKRLEQMDKSIGYNYTTLWIIAGIFTIFMSTTLTLAFRDRKTSIETSVKRSIETMEKEGTLARVIDVFKQLAKDDKKVALILKQFGFL